MTVLSDDELVDLDLQSADGSEMEEDILGDWNLDGSFGLAEEPAGKEAAAEEAAGEPKPSVEEPKLSAEEPKPAAEERKPSTEEGSKPAAEDSLTASERADLEIWASRQGFCSVL